MDDMLERLQLMRECVLDLQAGVTKDNVTWFHYRTDDACVIDTDNRVFVFYLGTGPKFMEWLKNFQFWPREFMHFGCVHRGFAHNVAELNGTINNPLGARIINHPALRSGKPIELLGHSRGGPLAIMSALWIDSSGIDIDQVFTVAAARIGDKRFFDSYVDTGLAAKTFGVVASLDPVPWVPAWAHQHGSIHTVKTNRPIHLIKNYINALQSQSV